MRCLGWILLLATPVLAQDSGGAPGADPARLFPADTFAYLEADASALPECLPEWQIAKIASDPALKTFFGPAFEKLGIDPEKPVEALLKQFPVGDVLDGRAAVGVRGMSVVVHDAVGNDWRFRVSPGAPVDAKYMYRWIGMMVALDGRAGRNVTFDIDVDFLAVGRPGPIGKQLVEEALRGIGGDVKRDALKFKGLDATHVHVDFPAFGGVTYALNFYAVERDGTWYLASQTDTLEQALEGGPRASLAASTALAQARARFTSGRPLLFAHVDLGLLLDAYRPFIPPIVQEMGAIAGLNSIRGVGLGMSLVNGGLRESFGILLDGKPQGFWRILEGMPAGLKTLEAAPPGALGAFVLKLDMKVLRERILAFCADVVPGNEKDIDREMSREVAPGFDLVTEVLPALGDEASVLVYPAGPNDVLPGFVLRMDARDEAALGRLVGKIEAQVPAAAARFIPVDLPEGIKATRVAAATPYDIHIAVAKGRFFLASSPKLLGEAATKWGTEGSRSLLRDDPVLPLVLDAAGGAARNIAALAYVNLRGAGIEGLRSQMMWGQFIPAEWFDAKGVGELRRIPNHLTGVAIALRHDNDALVLDSFSPVGVMLPAVVSAVLFMEQRIVAQQVAIQQRGGTGRASLGINTKSSDGTGVKVLGLSGAVAGGLQQGDKIIGIDGVVIATMEDLDRELGNKKPGESAEVKVRRGDAEITVTIELGEEEAGW